MVSRTSGVSLTMITNAAKVRQYKGRFSLSVWQILAFTSRALTLLEKLRMCLQISTDVVLSYILFSFAKVNTFYRKTLISFAKNNVEIASALLISFTSFCK